MAIPGDLRHADVSTGGVSGAHPCCDIHMPAWFVQGKFVLVVLALDFVFTFVPVSSNTCLQQLLLLNCGVCDLI